MTSLLQSSTSPSPYAPSVLCCPPADDDAFACGAAHATKEAAAAACEQAAAEQQHTTQRLAELTMESPCIPIGVACAASALPADAKCAAAASSASPAPLASDRLAAVNAFVLNAEEPKRSMQELVHALMQELEGGKKDLNRLYNIMMSYDASGNEWKRYEFVDEKKKYTRNLIASVPGAFCLMLLVWNAEKGSPIHSHSGSECFMRVIQGEIVEHQFVVKGGEGDLAAKGNWNKMVASNIPASDITRTHKNEYKAGGCTFINDSLGVHAVENPFKAPAVTLHCYIPGYETCKSYQADGTESKGVKVQQCHISFDSEQGERTHN